MITFVAPGAVLRERYAALDMGMLAAALDARTLRGVETVVDGAASDVIVWVEPS